MNPKQLDLKSDMDALSFELLGTATVFFSPVFFFYLGFALILWPLCSVIARRELLHEFNAQRINESPWEMKEFLFADISINHASLLFLWISICSLLQKTREEKVICTALTTWWCSWYLDECRKICYIPLYRFDRARRI